MNTPQSTGTGSSFASRSQPSSNSPTVLASAGCSLHGRDARRGSGTGNPLFVLRDGNLVIEAIRKVGEGAMGEVYYALERQPTYRVVALKVSKKPGVDHELLRNEAMKQAQISEQAAFAPVYTAGVMPGERADEPAVGEAATPRRRYISMAFIHGTTLDKDCKQSEADPQKRMRAVAEVCDAVAVLHRRGLVHRDLKCSNVMIRDEDSRVVVIDLGLVCKEGRKDGDFCGTITHAPREAWPPLMRKGDTSRGRGEEDVISNSPRDVFSIGVIAYELLTGQLPFSTLDSTLSLADARPASHVLRDLQPDELAKRAKDRSCTPKRLVDEVSAYDDVLRRALAKRPNRRPTAAALAAELRGIADRLAAGDRAPDRSDLLGVGLAVAIVATAAAFLGGHADSWLRHDVAPSTVVAVSAVLVSLAVAFCFSLLRQSRAASVLQALCAVVALGSGVPLVTGAVGELPVYRQQIAVPGFSCGLIDEVETPQAIGYDRAKRQLFVACAEGVVRYTGLDDPHWPAVKETVCTWNELRACGVNRVTGLAVHDFRYAEVERGRDSGKVFENIESRSRQVLFLGHESGVLALEQAQIKQRSSQYKQRWKLATFLDRGMRPQETSWYCGLADGEHIQPMVIDGVVRPGYSQLKPESSAQELRSVSAVRLVEPTGAGLQSRDSQTDGVRQMESAPNNVATLLVVDPESAAVHSIRLKFTSRGYGHASRLVARFGTLLTREPSSSPGAGDLSRLSDVAMQAIRGKRSLVVVDSGRLLHVGLAKCRTFDDSWRCEGALEQLLADTTPGLRDGDRARSRVNGVAKIAPWNDHGLLFTESGNHTVRVVRDSGTNTFVGVGEEGQTLRPDNYEAARTGQKATGVNTRLRNPGDVVELANGDIVFLDVGNGLLLTLRRF